MKKAIITMAVLFMLFACSDDTIQDVNNQINTEDNSGGITTKSIDLAIPYESPYEFFACPVNYVFINETELDMYLYPMVGLAYYDGAYDSMHHSWPLSTAMYPVLYPEVEYLKILTCRQMYFPAHTTEETGLGPQLPTLGSILPSGQFFDLSINPGIVNEPGILYEAGKFYGLEGRIEDPANPGVLAGGGWLKFSFLPLGITDPNVLSSDWKKMPSMGINANGDYWYNVKTGEICPGNSTVAGDRNVFSDKPSSITFNYSGVNYEWKAYTTATDVVVSLKEI